jgi:predicted permease
MEWFETLKRRARVLFNRSRIEREMDEEMRFHVEMEIEELKRRGMSPEEARRQAFLRFGGVERHKEEGRDARGIRLLVDLGQDLRFALRMLRKNPGFTAVTMLTLALGIGATTAIFSVVDGVLLKPLPYAEPDRLVQVLQKNSPTNQWPLSVVDYQAIEAQQRSFDHLAGLNRGRAILTGGDQPERIRVGYVTADWFNTLGIQPAEGRGFRAGEDSPGAEPVAVISHTFRERHFGRDADAVGRTITLDGVDFVVVGVLPPGLGSVAGWRAEVWPALELQTPSRRGPFFIQTIGRLANGVTMQDAAQDLAGISERIFPLWAETFQDSEARLTPFSLQERMIGNVGNELLLLLGAVGFVLLIAVANVANLQLARATAREREVAVRTSMGATRGRLVRQLLVESTTLAILGGVVGLVLAGVALDALLSLGPQLPRIEEVGVDVRALSFAAATTLISGVLFGLAPLAHGTAKDLATPLRSGARAGSEGKRSRTLRGALVTAEFALALPLLAGAALLFASLERLNGVDHGIETEGVLTARVTLPPNRYPDAAAITRYWQRALPELAAAPGIAAVGISSALPPDNPGMTNNFDLVDRPVPEGTSQPVAPWILASPGFLDALGIRLIRGRLPDEADAAGDLPVVAVSERWADRFYPGEEVIGRQVYSGGNRTTPVTVVGVVTDVKYLGLDSADDGAVYMSYASTGWRSLNLFMRSEGAPPTAAQLRAQFDVLDPEVPVTELQMLSDQLSASVARPRYWATLVGIFALVGVTLAAVGIYGVLSYFVSRQTRDIGVRMALGADASSVRRMVVRRGMGQAALGLAAGVAAALFLTRWLDSLLFQISPTDPMTLGVVTIALIAVALVACYWPARRATKVDPVRALSEE